MRFAIFSDIHANIRAWEAVRNDMDKQAVEHLLCLGDVVGYGPCPQRVLDAIRKETENFVLGNHDAVIGGVLDPVVFNENAREIIEWTREQLDDESAEFFKKVPLHMKGDGFILVHAEVADPGSFGYLDDIEKLKPQFKAMTEPLAFIGHTHHPKTFVQRGTSQMEMDPNDFTVQEGRKYIVNVGSVGEPRTDDVRASYCIYDTNTKQVTFRKVAFDIEAYRADLMKSGLKISPYFLQIHDYGAQAAPKFAEEAMVAAPKIALRPVTTTPKALVVPAQKLSHYQRPLTGQLRQYPPGRRPTGQHPASEHLRPVPQPIPKKSSSKLPLFLTLGMLAITGIGGFIFWKQQQTFRDEDEELVDTEKLNTIKVEADVTPVVKKPVDPPAAKLDQAYAAEVLRDAPIAYYRFENAGDRAYADGEVGPRASVVKGQGGVFFGKPMVALPRLGNAFLVNRANGALETEAIPITEQGTVEFWYQRNEEPKEGTLATVYKSANGGASVTENYENKTVGIAINGDEAPVHAIAFKYAPPNIWHHICIAWDHSKDLVYPYWNGELVGKVPVKGRYSPKAEFTPLMGVTAEGQVQFIGALDEIALYDKLLPAETVKERYQSGWVGAENLRPRLLVPMQPRLTNRRRKWLLFKRSTDVCYLLESPRGAWRTLTEQSGWPVITLPLTPETWTQPEIRMRVPIKIPPGGLKSISFVRIAGSGKTSIFFGTQSFRDQVMEEMKVYTDKAISRKFAADSVVWVNVQLNEEDPEKRFFDMKVLGGVK